MEQSEIRIGEQVILKALDKDDTDKIVTIVRWHADLMPDSANIKFDDGMVGTFDISRLKRIT